MRVRKSPPIGASPSGKAPAFGAGIRRFESCRPSHILSLAIAIVLPVFLTGCDRDSGDSERSSAVLSLDVPQPVVPRSLEEPVGRTVSDVVERGETLSDALLSHEGVGPPLVHAIVTAARPERDLGRVHVGDGFQVRFDGEGRFASFRYRAEPTTDLVVEVGTDGDLDVRLDPLPVVRSCRRAAGTVDGSLWVAVRDAGTPPDVAMEFTDLLAWEVDFLTETRSGDTFSILWEELFLDGEKVGTGDILALRYANDGELHELVRYEDEEGVVDHYDPQGRSGRLQFLRSPLNYRRISSGFSYSRRHPILKTVRPHLGIDYAAPHGTPVVASGDGKVVFAGRKGPNGNMVKMRHGSIYHTYYLHLARFARGVRAGARVEQGQVIGYVGSTGRSTGPHLDYRMQRHDRFVNPLKERPAETRQVSVDEMNPYGVIRARLLRRLDGEVLVDAPQGGAGSVM